MPWTRMGEWRYSSIILDLGTRWRWSASCPSRFTPWGNSPRYPLDRRLGGPQSWSGRCGEKSLAPARNRTRAVQHVLCRYSGSWSKLTVPLKIRVHNISVSVSDTTKLHLFHPAYRYIAEGFRSGNSWHQTSETSILQFFRVVQFPYCTSLYRGIAMILSNTFDSFHGLWQN
jgi:hypothetical protein